MKQYLLLAFIGFFISLQAQKKSSVDEFDFASATKKDYKSYKNGFETKTVITDFGTFKLGDELKIKEPFDDNSNEFGFITIGKYSLMNALSAVRFIRSNSNTSVLINKIRVFKAAMGIPPSIIVDIKSKDGSNLGGVWKLANIHNLERAIATGEIENPNAPLNREQAIAKLKEAKDLLELEMMSQEEYDKLKEELTPIIRGNQ